MKKQIALTSLILSPFLLAASPSIGLVLSDEFVYGLILAFLICLVFYIVGLVLGISFYLKSKNTPLSKMTGLRVAAWFFNGVMAFVGCCWLIGLTNCYHQSEYLFCMIMALIGILPIIFPIAAENRGKKKKVSI